ncbi:MAG TPA: hypothetical protein VGF69_02085 [Thermoanaerobaculia bacterium]|jgi:hypothetical protein
MNTALDFYSLLPALYRIKDEERSGALRALLRILQAEADHLRRNVDDLYDDFFIETCAPWVVPYIGELVANNPIYEVPGTPTRRADVARTLHYRHGKGTQRILEQLAHDVTGWSAHVVAFFELLEWTQNVNHIRLKVGTVDVRDEEKLDRFDGPFDTIAHTADVRPPAQASGWHNVPNTGFFLWRLRSHRLTTLQPRQAANVFGWHVSPIGNPAPLFHLPATFGTRALTREEDVEAPIRAFAMHHHIDSYYGAGLSLALFKDGSDTPIPPGAICTMDLRDWRRPAAGRVGVDVRSGRVTFPVGEEADSLIVNAVYGFSGDLGSGPYDRDTTILVSGPDTAIVDASAHPTLQDAIDAALALPAPNVVVTIADNATYEEDLTFSVGAQALTIQAESTFRPTLIGSITVQGTDLASALTLSGLLIGGGVRVDGRLALLKLLHTTLVPGRTLDEQGAPRESHLPSISVATSNTRLKIELERSITGPISTPSESLGITSHDSIIDAAAQDGEGTLVPALVSGALPPVPVLTSPQRKLVVSIGERGPRTITLPVPASLTQLAAAMQSAIRALSDAPEHKAAIVAATSDTLLLLGGDGTRVRVSAANNDATTAAELKLDEPNARQTLALLGSIRETIDVGFAPELDVVVDEGAPVTLAFNTPADLAAARDALAQELQSAGIDADVILAGNRLIAVPGDGMQAIRFIPSAGDRATVRALGLASVCAAIAGDPAGIEAGPMVTLDETTILGRVFVRQIEASNSIFDAPVIAQRRQTGCVRFSYVAPHSQLPRRFRCQPDTDARVEPAFTSRRYGDPAYGQLSLACAEEIRRGADDGFEMGAFHFLMQPQRETNLRVRLAEYLPFGLDAALIYVT